MAKFFQHLEPVDNIMGKVARLKYIDDIHDDEMTIYYFSDGTKCNKDFIAELNDIKAVENQMFMAEVSDPINIWKLTKKVIKVELENKKISNEQGEWEVPDPGLGVVRNPNGEGYMTDASRKSKNGAIAIESIPPKHSNKNVEPVEDYLLSLHPELEFAEETNNKSQGMLPTTKLTLNSVNKPTITTTTSTTTKQPILSNPITTNVTEVIRHAEITINLDDIMKNNYEKINILNNGEAFSITPDELYKRILNVVPESSKVEQKDTCEFNNIEEDVLITNMIEKSKKEECTIGIDVVMSLPPIEVYKTIKQVYPEGMTDQFVNSLAERTACKELKNALTLGLKAFYDEENNCEINN